MNTVMHILQFASSTHVRRSGEQVGQKIATYLTTESVTLDFSETSPSASFLEGLVLTLHQHDRLHDTTFISDDAPLTNRLARISRRHTMAIYVRRAGEPGRSTVISTPA